MLLKWNSYIIHGVYYLEARSRIEQKHKIKIYTEKQPRHDTHTHTPGT